ncbi:MAG TPA: hypothetical protein VLT15_01510 [Acidimicrobiia bacterium]|nr:hypothetical protein [Acidimicrobiia bacterium]
MNSDFIVELIGYVGSAFVVVSLTRTSILKLRLFGLAGAAFFVVYSVIIEAYPIAVVNIVIVGIHLYFLRGLLSRKSELFTTLEVRGDSRYLDYFLRFHEDDIRNYREDFRFEPREDQIRVFVLRDLVPAGLLIGRPCADHAFEVELDYVIPRYRDLRIAEFLFSPSSGVFTDPLCKRAWSRPGTSSNVEYLEKMGFERAADDDGSTIYVKDLAPAEP